MTNWDGSTSRIGTPAINGSGKGKERKRERKEGKEREDNVRGPWRPLALYPLLGPIIERNRERGIEGIGGWGR